MSRERGSGLVALARAQLPALLLVATFLTAIPLLLTTAADSRVPLAWPAAGLLVAVMLVTERSQRGSHVVLGGVLLVLAHLLTGYDAVSAVGFGIASLAGAAVTYRRLTRGMGSRRVGLLEDGDVSRLISAATQGSVVAAAVAAVVVLVSGVGTAWLAAVAVFGTHAAAVLMLLPLVVEGPSFTPMATVRERIVQSVLTVGFTAVLFSIAAAPPLVFAVMPMFAWLAFRGTLRESSLLLLNVGIVASAFTLFGLGPVHELGARYGLAPELQTGFLQLFLIDCALLLLPLSVMTTQQRASAAREAAGRATLQRLVDAATGSAIIAVDLDGRVEVFNPGAEQVFGASAEQTVGRRADRLFTDLELVRHARRLGTAPLFAEICAAAALADADREQWHFQRPGGEPRQLLLTVTAVLDERQQVAGYLCVGEDVTEREAAHRSLLAALEHERDAVERLSQLEQVKSDFVATVSHELRTPLTSMIGYVELLEDGEVGELTGAQRSLAGRVQRNGRRLLLLVEDLLLLSQVEARQLSMDPVASDLRDTVAAAYDALGTTLAARRLSVVLRLPERPVRHEADPDQMERVVTNLLGNAVKFTPDGGHVDVEVSERGDGVELVVRDSGAGIPEAEQAQLFTRFFRSSNATAQAVPGTGLGLTIVKAIVERHGGQVSISSTEGTGTTVTVALPRTLPVEQATPPSAPTEGVEPDQSATPYKRSPASPSPGTM